MTQNTLNRWFGCSGALTSLRVLFRRLLCFLSSPVLYFVVSCGPFGFPDIMDYELPIDRWFGTKQVRPPNPVFVCIALTSLPSHLRNSKVDPSAIKCAYLGLSQDRLAYRFYSYKVSSAFESCIHDISTLLFMDSDATFDYDDDDSCFSYDDESVLHSDELPKTLPVGVLDDFEVAPRESLNLLCKCTYRPLRVLWYIQKNFVDKARGLGRSILPSFSTNDLLVMLHFKKWLVDELTGDYYDNWPRLRDGCGLTDTRGEVHGVKETEFSCSVCCEDGHMLVFGLLCGHTYCSGCYLRYVEARVAQGVLIRCMEPQCNLSLYHEDVELLLASEDEPEPVEVRELGSDSDSDDEYDHQYDHLDLSGRFVMVEPKDPILHNRLLVSAARMAIDALHTRYRWCPSVDCASLVELARNVRPENYDKNSDCDLANLAVVSCPAGHEFCFDCQYENHLPCPCWVVGKWIKRCEDDSETANWIEANTQSCPKCHALIEKNGGCNHMTCRKCRFEFCWICLGDWTSHNSANWVCNRYEAKEVEAVKKRKSDVQNSLNRYLHFYKRFSVHQRSMLGDENTLQSVHRCMLLYMKAQQQNTRRTVSWNDVQFLSDAIRSLTSGRKTLMWTYAFAFYLEKTNFSEIFEGMQDFLNKTVEDLSRLFEDINEVQKNGDAVMKITKRKSEIVNLAALVARRQQLLVECAHSGIQQNTLQFADT